MRAGDSVRQSPEHADAPLLSLDNQLPPFTVASLATITHSCPSTSPIPVTIPAEGASFSYISHAASGLVPQRVYQGRRATECVRGPAVCCVCDVWQSPPHRLLVEPAGPFGEADLVTRGSTAHSPEIRGSLCLCVFLQNRHLFLSCNYNDEILLLNERVWFSSQEQHSITCKGQPSWQFLAMTSSGGMLGFLVKECTKYRHNRGRTYAQAPYCW